MAKFEKILIITHIAWRKNPPFKPIEGPYSSVARALVPEGKEIETCQIPLFGFDEPLLYGEWQKEQSFKLPSFLGRSLFLKYILDILIISFFLVRFNLFNQGKKKLVIGIDPLSCLPASFLKKLMGCRVVFYSADFSESRFANKFLQKLYEKADETSSRLSDQVWVQCYPSQEYKKEHYGVDSFYIPNSFPFNPDYYRQNKNKRGGNKVVWTGSFSSNQQIIDTVKLVKEIQRLRPEMRFWFVPSNKINDLRRIMKKFKLKRGRIFDVAGQEASRKIVSQGDLGLAIYDKNLGVTKFTGPIKIWEYAMCGLPFIISCEPASQVFRNSGVAYFLNPGNQIPKDNSLAKFIRQENLKKLGKTGLELARKYDARKTVIKALENLTP